MTQRPAPIRTPAAGETKAPTRARTPSDRRLRLALAGGLLAALLPACKDNPACVFGGGCQELTDPGGMVGSNPATFPAQGEWIVDGVPVLESLLPSGTAAHPTSPILMRFSESISPASLQNAFTVQAAGTGGFGGAPILTSSPAGLGDGRLVVLLPTMPMPPAQYEVLLADNALITDLTGQALRRPTDGVLGTFTVTAMPPAEPRLLATYPAQGNVSQSTTTQIVAVFDRAMNPATVTTSSFVVRVDGAAPAQNPAPQAYAPFGGAPDARLFTWRSVDAMGSAVPLTTGGQVQLTLAPAGNPILDANPMPGTLPTTVVSFGLATVQAPLSVAITSAPTDAIGIGNLTGPADLVIDVDLANGLTGDRLEIFVFGTSRVQPPDTPQLTVITRQYDLAVDGNLVQLTAMDMNLLASAVPLLGRLADGDIAIAVRTRRGATTTTVRVLDVDPSDVEIQDPVQDLRAPTFQGFGASGNEMTTMRSLARDVVVVGRADEPLSAVLVTAMPTGGDVTNELMPGEPPPVVGSNAAGLFIAAPVVLGVVDPAELPLPFTLTLYDRALNTTALAGLSFQQKGVLGPDDVTVPAGMVEVEVVNATTGAPIPSALVFTLQRDLGVVTPVPGGNGTTNASGVLLLPTAAMGETIVTVQAVGFDLFTFQGLTSNRISVPLEPTGAALGLLSGVVTTTNSMANAFVRELADSRAPLPGDVTATVSICSSDPFTSTLSCPFTNVPVLGGLLGAQTLLLTDVPANEFNYSALTFLRAFVLQLPLAPVIGAQGSQIEIPYFLNDPGVDPEERPIDYPAHELSENATTGIDFMNLAGPPEITLEAKCPGLLRPVTIGRGVAFQNVGLGTWNVRAAYPGVADGTVDAPTDVLGRLVTDGTIDPDLLAREEFLDVTGSRSGARPRLSSLPASVEPLNVTSIVAPLPDGATGGLSFNLAFTQAITDALGREGVYRVVLLDGAGRRWNLYGVDTADGTGNVVVHVPDLAAQGGASMAAGNLFCTVSAFTFPVPGPGDPTLTEMLFSDVQREHDLFSHTRVVRFDYPN